MFKDITAKILILRACATEKQAQEVLKAEAAKQVAFEQETKNIANMKKEIGPLGWCPPARYKGAVSGFVPALRRLTLTGWGLIVLALILWL